MLRESKAFSGFSVNDVGKAELFYTQILGLEVKNTGMGLELHLGNGLVVFVYQKDDHIPASFTILNFPVDDVTDTVAALTNKGVEFIHYENLPHPQDEYGILRGKSSGYGPDIAWFNDPAGNIFSVLSN